MKIFSRPGNALYCYKYSFNNTGILDVLLGLNKSWNCRD